MQTSQDTVQPSGWHVVYTAAKAERHVHLGLRDRGMASYLPAMRRMVRSGRQRRPSECPLFPRYVFLACESVDWFAVGEVVGLIEVVRVAGQACRVPARIIADLQSAERAGAFDQTRPRPARPAFEPGQTVRIIGGAMTGFTATIMRAAPGDRMRVLLAMAGRAMPVDVPVADLIAA